MKNLNKMILKELLLDTKNIDFSLLNTEIADIAIDSRLVKKSSIFFALPGQETNGEKFIDSAFRNGAVLAVCNWDYQGPEKNIIRVKDVYQTLICALQKFYPNLPENILAVTGTNGKTSTAYFICQMQEILGKKSASIGTLGVKFSDTPPSFTDVNSPPLNRGNCAPPSFTDVNSPPLNRGSLAPNQLIEFSLTTPDIVSLYKNLSILKANNINDVAIEASSIGLEQKRLAGLKIGLGAFTNFSQDHLDYHGTMQKYFDCKMLLFKDVLSDGSIAVLNEDIAEFEQIKKIAVARNLKIFTYSATKHSLLTTDSSLELKFINELTAFKKFSSGIYFQDANLFCALLSVVAYYRPNQEQIELLVNNLGNIKPAEGRMQIAATLKNSAQIFVDFAHTPDALKNILQATQKTPHNHLYVLFGCGGNRDKSKRPIMGKIASDLADFVIVTDDNPRTEDAATIRKEILQSCDQSKTNEFNNRQLAIEQTIIKLKARDILIVAGKGHEKYQIIGDKKLPFDENKIINDFIAKNQLN